jgi:polar amino acid transport system substrate-binding protein
MLLVKKGNPDGLTSIADLCGKTVAVQRGTTQAGYAKQQSKDCTADGKPAIDLLEFDRETEAMLQVKNGRAASGLQDYPVATYNARTSGGGKDFEVVGDQIDAGPLGIGVSKDATQLRDALQKALQAVMDSGDYKKLIDEYQTPLGALESATINGGS